MQTTILFCSLFLLPLAAFGQYRDIEQAGGGNPGLRDLGPGFVIEQLTDGQGIDEWASSYHEAEGKAPPEPDFSESIEGMDEDADLTAESQVRDEWNRWARMYGAGSAQDGNLQSAWVEGVPGNGEGEVLIVRLYSDTVRIWNGFQRSRDLFAKNGRVREVEVFVLETEVMAASQFDVFFQGLHVVAHAKVMLKDVFGPQPLPLPRYTSQAAPEDGPPQAAFLAIRILSVYPGSKYADTAITEVQN